MMQRLAPEDQEIYRQIREAVQNGNTELANKLTEQLKQKYPNLPIRGGSGS